MYRANCIYLSIYNIIYIYILYICKHARENLLFPPLITIIMEDDPMDENNMKDIIFQNKEKIQQQQRKHSLIEEETQEQVQLEHAIEEARELRQQLDEAGRIGLQLYEENVRLKEEAEDMESDFLELEKSVETWKLKAMHSDKHLKIHVGQLEDSERQIEVLEKRVKDYESKANVAEKKATENEHIVEEEKKLLIKNRFKLGALKATMSIANLKSGTKMESQQEVEKIKLKNEELEKISRKL